MHILELVNIFFSGILAGLEIAVHYGFNGPTLALDTKPQILLRQGIVKTLRWLVPAFFIPAIITTVVLLISSRGTHDLIGHAIALFAFAIWIYARVFVTVKINAASLDWDANNPPNNWRESILKAERFHIIGTWVALVAFISLLVCIV